MGQTRGAVRHGTERGVGQRHKAEMWGRERCGADIGQRETGQRHGAEMWGREMWGRRGVGQRHKAEMWGRERSGAALWGRAPFLPYGRISG